MNLKFLFRHLSYKIDEAPYRKDGIPYIFFTSDKNSEQVIFLSENYSTVVSSNGSILVPYTLKLLI